jgi:hypothetical protein
MVEPSVLVMAPLRGSGTARPSGALRAIDPTACPHSWRTFGPRRLRRQSQPSPGCHGVRPTPNPGPNSPNEPDGIFTANLKDVELTNRACFSLEELAAAAEQGIGRVRGEPKLLVGFLHQAGLSL